MAPPAANATSSNDPIDLTMSDEEDATYLSLAHDRANVLPTSAATPSSHHGLPDLHEYSEAPRPQIMAVVTGAKNRVQLGSTARGSPQTLTRDNRKSTAMPVSNAQPSSYNYNVENASISTPSSRVAPNSAVKRKRWDGNGVPNLATSSAAPQSRVVATPTNTIPGSKMLIDNSRHPVPVRASPTVITGDSRAEASRVPNTSSPSQHGGMGGRDDDMEQCLHKQVLSHVHSAVDPFNSTLTHLQRSDIGQTVASNLVSQHSFLKNYLANNRSLSEDYERNLAQTARVLVNEEVKKILSSLADAADASEDEPPALGSIHPPPVTSGNRESFGLNSTESRSSSAENAFEHRPSKLARRQPTLLSTTNRNDFADVGGHQGQGMQSGLRDVVPAGASGVAVQKSTYSKQNGARGTKALVAAESRLKAQARSSTQTSPSPAASARFPPVVKEKRKRRTKAEMEAARAAEEAAYGYNYPVARGRGRDASNHDRGSSRAESSKPANVPLAPGNFARSASSQLPPAPVHHSGLPPSTPQEYDLRPYYDYRTRQDVAQKLRRPEIVKKLSKGVLDLFRNPAFHVDFTEEELRLLCGLVIEMIGRPKRSRSADFAIEEVMKGHESRLPDILQELKSGRQGYSPNLLNLLRTRNLDAISYLLNDAVDEKVGRQVKLSIAPLKNHKGPTSITALLREREMYGLTPARPRRGQNSCRNILRCLLEDKLVRQSEWTDCSSDISSISWTGDNTFIGGALAHSDSHNMQYNKPGNLLLGSLTLDSVRSYPDHKTERPVVARLDNAENALPSMRTTQSPWLYDSVVSTAYCEFNGFAFTASFDKTVKIWSVSIDGSSMALRGTWKHEGKVNFVVTSPHHDHIATASETNINSVRIYNFEKDDISNSGWDDYCGNRTTEQGEDVRRRETWAYQPATMQWGKSLSVMSLLLVGYSPRSNNGDEDAIPEEKRNSGELCLWNALKREEVLITSSKTQNVFEVIWHPTQPIFLAATSPTGKYDNERTRTQIRLFAQSEDGQRFTNIKILDCPALDINELTVMPNSMVESFVTASCTDGMTYVWDTVRGDLPIHVLQHGDSLDNPDPFRPREVSDDGVKFAAWGQSSDRFYTGGSDGMLKAWNLKAPPGKAFVRNVLSVSGGISTGVFNEDRSKLLIGDATGKIYYLSIDDSDVAEYLRPKKPSLKLPLAVGSQLSTGIKRPKVIIPHSEPEPPENPKVMDAIVEETAAELSQRYLEHGILVKYPNEEFPHSQRAVFQGPAYMNSCLFNLDSHIDEDLTQELIPSILAQQQFVVRQEISQAPLRLPLLPRLQQASDPALHRANVETDFGLAEYPTETIEGFAAPNNEVELDYFEYEFMYEALPRSEDDDDNDDEQKEDGRRKKNPGSNEVLDEPSGSSSHPFADKDLPDRPPSPRTYLWMLQEDRCRKQLQDEGDLPL